MNLLDKVVRIASSIDEEKLQGIVKAVECLYPELAGNKKKEKAIEFINKIIDIPILDEKDEKGLFSFLVGRSIDLIVLLFNKTIWKK